MTQTPDVAAIAAGLTKAQRQGILYDGFWWTDGRKLLCGNGSAMLSLRRKGLCGGHLHRITILGLAVRAHLLEDTSHG